MEQHGMTGHYRTSKLRQPRFIICAVVPAMLLATPARGIPDALPTELLEKRLDEIPYLRRLSITEEYDVGRVRP
ncbi:hypothetical protein ABEW03_11400 [Virgibacillus pantothenticus]|uniref:hypothetical protein n=1 Tax=Virgibacillus pantothenticus TaxID=1473 RepID=UPI003D2C28A6